DSITLLSNSAVHRKYVDDSLLGKECYICMGSWQIGEEVATLRCECPSWTHEACLAKSVFQTGGCPTCRKSIDLIDDETVLATAAANGDTEKVIWQLDNGIQHSPRGYFDSTPLLRAAEHGHRDTIRLLLKKGASISEQDSYQRTALHWASVGGHAEAAEELLSQGADMSPLNKKEQTYLHLAVQSTSVETVRVLLEQGAMISARDLEGSSALHLAADGGHLEIIDLLIDKEAKVDTVDQLGRTPLHRSAWLGHGAATKLLVDRGAVVEAVDNDGHTARDLAEEMDQGPAIKALESTEGQWSSKAEPISRKSRWIPGVDSLRPSGETIGEPSGADPQVWDARITVSGDTRSLTTSNNRILPLNASGSPLLSLSDYSFQNYKRHHMANRLYRNMTNYAELYGADVALIIDQKGLYYTYGSPGNPCCPPSKKENINSFPVPISMLPHDVSVKYQRKRNPDDPEQVGSSEKGCADTDIVKKTG
ncbi:hypothetical protein V490_00484, partial [Pseudogymnoascus sp. VKM F-3557]